MMSVEYSVNNNKFLGVHSNWQRLRQTLTTEGLADFADWSTNTWAIPRMSVASFEVLRGVQGTKLTQFSTNDINDRNTQQTYAEVYLDQVVNGLQVGRRMTNVNVRFRVKVS